MEALFASSMPKRTRVVPTGSWTSRRSGIRVGPEATPEALADGLAVGFAVGRWEAGAVVAVPGPQPARRTRARRLPRARRSATERAGNVRMATA